ncbi:hypothetical protein ACS0TY_033244 [Phlomoides rotata]
MAEVAVTAALVLVEIVSPFLQNLNSQKNVQKIDISIMKSWLSLMKAFIEENYGREGSTMLKVKMDQVRKISYKIEDVLEEFVLHSPPYTFHTHQITRKIHNTAHQLYHNFPLHKILKKIQEINREIDSIRAQIAALPAPASDPTSQPSSSGTSGHRVSRRLLDHEMVGYEKPKTEFMRQLVGGETKLLTLAVSGPRGSGKTTFAKNVFWKQGIRGRFDCHAWVYVSGRCDVELLLINLLKQLCASRKELYPADDGSNMSDKLRRYLAGKRYLVALDDIWRQEDWDDIKNALPDAFRGSRIIVTTSSSDLAFNCASSGQLVYSLESLEWLEGWKLFCREAFPNTKGECPSDLKDSAVKIVKRCEGLPLAIVAVAGALMNKRRLPFEWERFHDNLGDEIRSGSKLSVINNALLPSYMDLSTNLKCCFLCFGFFPEDYSVKRGRLISLWVAESFAMGTDCKTAEEVAEEYLIELIQRNLVHVTDWEFDGRPRNCRVLNLILKFIIQKCKDENFASIFGPHNRSQSEIIRHLSVHDDCTNLPGNSVDLCGVRSMFLLRLTSKPPSDFEKDLCKLKFLRVFEAQGAPLRELPRGITRLTLLKYLSFRDTQIKTIHSSIKNLSYLETLDLKQTDVTELPKEICYLHNLRHLFVYKKSESTCADFDSVQGAKVCEGIGNLIMMQDLCHVKIGKKGGTLKDMRKLTQLRKLGLMGLNREHGTDLCTAVEEMINLTTLDLCAATKDEFLEVGEMRNPPQTLQRLYLKGRLKEFPRWISSIKNLLRVRLMWSKMEASPLQALEILPHLMELQLVDCCIEQELTFSAWGFQKLNSIVIEDMTKLHTIVIQAGAMPQLKQMSIRKCHQMKLSPLGLQYLRLGELTLYDMVEEFIVRLKGEDREWVQEIPVIHSFTLHNQTWSFENLSPCFSN